MKNREATLCTIAVLVLFSAGCSNGDHEKLSKPPPVGVVPPGADNPQAREAAAREAQKEAALKKAQSDVPKP